MITAFDQLEILGQEITAGTAKISFRIPSELAYFKDHFPGQPILPGVVQLDWAIAVADKAGIRGTIVAIERLKFTHLILPEKPVELLIQSLAQQPGFTFSYQHAGLVFSSGKIVHAGN